MTLITHSMPKLDPRSDTPKPAASNLMEFEPVSLAMARDVLNDMPAALERMLEGDPAAWEKFRTAQTREDKRLGKHAMAWLSALPKESRPLRTAVHFTHVVNRLAALWNKGDELDVYFEGLLNSRRRNRQGFPLDVHTELQALRALLGR